LSITTIINNDKNIKERLKIAQKNLELNQAILDSSIETKIEKIQLLSSETNVISDMIDNTNNFKTKIQNFIQKIEDEKNIIETKQEELDNLYKIIHENEWYCNECNKFGGQEL